uniref:Uncharacterized protein n=1 Tax=Tanacetum cinerariifolium TaxID=118510 RepID=A0A6L2MV51_TANCI|nr:hypothetical protein [Tanacetum cinerariifolium]
MILAVKQGYLARYGSRVSGYTVVKSVSSTFPTPCDVKPLLNIASQGHRHVVRLLCSIWRVSETRSNVEIGSFDVNVATWPHVGEL